MPHSTGYPWNVILDVRVQISIWKQMFLVNLSILPDISGVSELPEVDEETDPINLTLEFK